MYQLNFCDDYKNVILVDRVDGFHNYLTRWVSVLCKGVLVYKLLFKKVGIYQLHGIYLL